MASRFDCTEDGCNFTLVYEPGTNWAERCGEHKLWHATMWDPTGDDTILLDDFVREQVAARRFATMPDGMIAEKLIGLLFAHRGGTLGPHDIAVIREAARRLAPGMGL